jgi:hypothetical protein
VDHIAHGVLIGLHQPGDDRDGVTAGRGQQDHRPPMTDRAHRAAPHDPLQLLPFLIREPADPDRLRHLTSRALIEHDQPAGPSRTPTQ